MRHLCSFPPPMVLPSHRYTYIPSRSLPLTLASCLQVEPYLQTRWPVFLLRAKPSSLRPTPAQPLNTVRSISPERFLLSYLTDSIGLALSSCVCRASHR